MAVILHVFPDWYKVNHTFYRPVEQKEWCKENIGESDHDTWHWAERTNLAADGSFGTFSFKEEKWALMFVLRWL